MWNICFKPTIRQYAYVERIRLITGVYTAVRASHKVVYDQCHGTIAWGGVFSCVAPLPRSVSVKRTRERVL